jgi:DNA mismatch repair ATPase MutS
VLAGAGGPVCASAWRSPPLTVWTAMRVQDSLERGVSYFMAELLRLKAVVDGVRAAAAVTAGPRPLYLLDEILQGTNTAERQIAARRIIAELVRLGALGAVSTHDLTLAEGGELARLAHAVHFTETITNGADGPAMTFDYRLRPGPATSSNALRLMAIVGLELPEAGTPAT